MAGQPPDGVILKRLGSGARDGPRASPPERVIGVVDLIGAGRCAGRNDAFPLQPQGAEGKAADVAISGRAIAVRHGRDPREIGVIGEGDVRRRVRGVRIGDGLSENQLFFNDIVFNGS
jgi:hypothetical protein